MIKLENTLTSNEVAEMIGKEHSKLIRDIRTYIGYLAEAKIGSGDFFVESTYKDGNNQERPNYLLTKQGCEMVSNKITGAKGVQFTAKYVSRFNQMETHIKQQSEPSQLSYREQALLALAANEETNERVDKVESDVKYLIEEVRLDASRYDALGRFINTKIRQIISERALNAKAQKPLRQDLNRSVNTICGVRTRNQIKDKDYEKAIKVVEDWQPSTLAIHEARQLSFEQEIA